MNILQANDLKYHVRGRRGNKTLIDVPSLHIKQNQFTALIGPNGAGKTTLLHLLSGDTNPSEGDVLFNGRPLKSYSIIELSQRRAVLPQLQHIPFAINVLAILSMGLTPYGVTLRDKAAQSIVSSVSQALGLETLLDQTYQVLSGGEQHRTQIGRVLVQILFELELSNEPRVLLLDEPFNHLDLYHQKHLLAYLKTIQEKGVTIICVMHDLNQALYAADTAILLKQGNIMGIFDTESLKDGKILGNTFGVEFITLSNPKIPEVYALSIFN